MKHPGCDKIRPFNLTNNTLPDFRSLAITALMLIITPSVMAETNWSQCSVAVIESTGNIDYAQFPSRVYSDQIISSDQQLYEFIGDVSLKREQQQIQADRITFNNETRQMQANGNTRYSDHLITLSADEIQLDDREQNNRFSEVNFQLHDSHLRGSAHEVLQLDEQRKAMTDVRYTTCDPDDNAWSLGASRMLLDQQRGLGTAIHTVFRVKDIPVFYFPWFQFPIDDRRMSGLLPPTLTTSNTNGTQFALPIYWNIAPSLDMTITPINYTRRGIQFNTENRYLFENGFGQIDLSTLDDEVTDSDRWFRRWAHEMTYADIHTNLLVQRVSDQEYIEDFDHLPTVEDVDFLRSALVFSGTLADWSAQLLFEEYQLIDQARVNAQPYRRLPQFTLNRQFNLQQDRLQIDWQNEFVTFDKDNSTTGSRLHINPALTIPLADSYYFINTRLELDLVQYQLDAPDQDESRSIPLISIDSGLYFDRLLDDGKWLNTLEPRLYLLYVPYEDQGQLPNFDSSLLGESYNNLFINNRFNGADRVGDSRQISIGITTRLIDNLEGREWFNASIGQAFYDQPRRVSLNNTVDERDKSSLIATINYLPHPLWQLSLTGVYDQQQENTEQTDATIRLRDGDTVFNLEHHMRDANLEQTTLSFVYPFNDVWRGFGKYQYSHRQETTVQNLIGASYESCCWAFTMLYEEDSSDDFSQTDYSVYFQVTFKGLSSAGKDIDSVLEDGILGYQPR